MPFDSRTFVKSTQNKVQLDLESKELFTMDNENSDDDYGFGDLLLDFLNGASWGILGLAGNVLSHDQNVAKIENFINSISSEFDPQPYLDTAFESKDKAIDFVKQTFISDLIEPLQDQIQEIRSKRSEKEKELEISIAKRNDLEERKVLIESQFKDFAQIKELLWVVCIFRRIPVQHFR